MNARLRQAGNRPDKGHQRCLRSEWPSQCWEQPGCGPPQREGATENAAGCTAPLADLRDRGLHTDRPTLVVSDGAKAPAKAVRNVFGERAIVQRCQAHKTRNVVEPLSDGMKPSVRQALRDAYAESNADGRRRRGLSLRGSGRQRSERQ